MTQAEKNRELCPKQAAGYLGISGWWLAMLRKRENGPPFERRTPGKIIYLEDDLEAWRHQNPKRTWKDHAGF